VLGGKIKLLLIGSAVGGWPISRLRLPADDLGFQFVDALHGRAQRVQLFLGLGGSAGPIRRRGPTKFLPIRD
jgi:hypothetical protein